MADAEVVIDRLAMHLAEQAKARAIAEATVIELQAQLQESQAKSEPESAS